MSVEIYYFTGTGNSLAIARDLAEKMDGKLLSIPSVMDQESIKTDADVIGIVFPVFFRAVLGGIPLIIRRFAGRLENIGSKYIFTVCTYGLGQPDYRILEEDVRIRGGKLSGGFGVKMPFYYLALSGYGAIRPEKQQEMQDKWKKKLEEIHEYVSSRKEEKMKAGGFLMDLLVKIGKVYYSGVLKKMTKIELPLPEHIQWMDCNFSLNEKCNSCGICARICPVKNIDMTSGKFSWLHHCEHCLACAEWCPKGAVNFGGKNTDDKRGHHPEMKMSDILKQKEELL